MYDTTMGGTRATLDWTSFNWSMVGPLALIFSGVMVFISRRK